MIYVYEIARGLTSEGERTLWTEVVDFNKPHSMRKDVRNLRELPLYNAPGLREQWEFIKLHIDEAIELGDL